MPSTTNFGWTTPADTDLVKDGASAIRTLGNGIDTSFVDLKGGTTGQVLSKNSNTDLDFTWVAQDDSNAIQNALLTTTGDTIYASAASTPARLGIGTTGQVLTVSAGGLPTWATSAASSTDFTLLNSGGTALTGAATITVNITAYTNIYVFVSGASSASASSEIAIRFNGDSGNNYRDNTISFERGDAAYGQGLGDVSLYTIGKMGNSATNVVTGCLQIFGAKSSTGVKPVQWMGAGGTSTLNKLYFGQALYLSTSSITSISVLSNAGNFDAGTVFIYGAN